MNKFDEWLEIYNDGWDTTDSEAARNAAIDAAITVVTVTSGYETIAKLKELKS